MLQDLTECYVNDVSFVGFYDDAKIVLGALLHEKEMDIKSIDFSDPVNGYSDEYLISIDSEYNIWCEPLKIEEEYLYMYCEKAYLAGDFNPVILKRMDCPNTEIIICEYEDEKENGEDESAELPHNFTKTWNDEFGSHYISFYSTNSEMVKDLLESFRDF
jgi:hypothetical protein